LHSALRLCGEVFPRGEDMSDTQNLEEIRLRISDELKELLEKRHILEEDIRQVIEYAERSGVRLLNRGSGHLLAHFRPETVTFWVEYGVEGGEFVIYNAYSHRMEVI